MTRGPSPPKRAPGWAWLLTGLAIGLFVAFLVYLNENSPPPSTPAVAARVPSPAAPPPRERAAARQPESDRRPAPRFEFYTILPEREVRVPEHEIVAAPRTETPAEPADAPRAYILQVGSFRQMSQADRLKANLALMGLHAEIQSVSVGGGDSWHRVRIGPFSDLGALNDARVRLRENRLEALVLRDKK